VSAACCDLYASFPFGIHPPSFNLQVPSSILMMSHQSRPEPEGQESIQFFLRGILPQLDRVAQDIINMLLHTLWPKLIRNFGSGVCVCGGVGVWVQRKSAVLNPVYILVIFGKRHFTILHSSTV